eukprot:CAMPEP_0195519212 /NCGR_PEP_ID=MMETSP0794_2-20130614/14520_1 /TAXON_ID=515487 /ORGANISM="Stephanopyxis turris, Strain CCMP 815" /LENGTH=153 /DNA_ID=CAMNT_0040648333 /DNA_START=124 /DNA_END=582 /DNA_ORIENTATION=+
MTRTGVLQLRINSYKSLDEPDNGFLDTDEVIFEKHSMKEELSSDNPREQSSDNPRLELHAEQQSLIMKGFQSERDSLKEENERLHLMLREANATIRMLKLKQQDDFSPHASQSFDSSDATLVHSPSTENSNTEEENTIKMNANSKKNAKKKLW